MPIFLTLLYLLSLVPLALYSGFAITLLWLWFVVPVFGLPELTVLQAIGIGLLLTYFQPHIKQPKQDEAEWYTPILESFVYGLMKPTLFIGFGWVVSRFV